MNNDLFLEHMFYLNFKTRKNNPYPKISEKNVNPDNLKKEIINTIRKTVSGFDNIGINLSGGLDSTINFIALQKVSKESGINIIPFYMINKEDICNTEIMNIEKLTKKFDIKINKIYINSDDIRRNFERLPQKIARFESGGLFSLTYFEKIRDYNFDVLIGGDGGDEIFGGYRIIKNILAQKRLPLFSSRIYKLKDSKIKRVITKYLSKNGLFLIGKFSRIKDYRYLLNDNDQTKELNEQIIKFFLKLDRKNKLSAVQDYIFQKGFTIVDHVNNYANHFDIKFEQPLFRENFLNYALNIPLEERYKEKTSKMMLRKAFQKELPENIYKFGIDYDKKGWGLSNDYLYFVVKDKIKKVLSKQKIYNKKYLKDMYSRKAYFVLLLCALFLESARKMD